MCTYFTWRSSVISIRSHAECISSWRIVSSNHSFPRTHTYFLLNCNTSTTLRIDLKLVIEETKNGWVSIGVAQNIWIFVTCLWIKTKPRQTVSVDGMRLSPALPPKRFEIKVSILRRHKKWYSLAAYTERIEKKTRRKVKMHELLYQLMFHLCLATAATFARVSIETNLFLCRF